MCLAGKACFAGQTDDRNVVALSSQLSIGRAAQVVGRGGHTTTQCVQQSQISNVRFMAMWGELHPTPFRGG